MKAHQGCSLDRAALEAYQLKRLQELIAILTESNAFYSARLEGASGLRSLQEFAHVVPFTRKSELAEDQAKHPPFGSNLTFSMDRYTRFNQTSGTTGRPMRWLDTSDSWDSMVDCWLRVFESAGVSSSDRIFFPFSFGPFIGFWVAFEAGTRLGCLTISGGGMRSPARLRAILDNEVTVLCITPSYAVHLAEVARDEHIDLSLSRVRRIIVAGEPGGSVPATRALIERLWQGARVVDHHGMTETGPVTYECPVRRGTLHVMETAFVAEIIDPQTRAHVPPGGTGELVLTNLWRAGSPLLRYRTGDIVRSAAASPCACGSFEMAMEGGILSRTDDMVIVRGVNVYPSAVEDVLRSCGIREFRVEIFTERNLTEMSILIEPETACDSYEAAALAGRVATALRNVLNLRIKVTCVSFGSLPRFEGKSTRWVRS